MARWLNLIVLLTPLTFLWAAIHRFHGSTCVHSYAQKTCGNNPHIPNSTIGIISAVLFVLALTILARRR